MWCALHFQFSRSPGKEGSHFNPYSNLFPPSERKGIAISTLCWATMFSLLIYLSFITSPLLVLKLYGIPYWVTKLLLHCYFFLLFFIISILQLEIWNSYHNYVIVWSCADICYVAGLCHILASPWSPPETALVPRQGNKNK